jgi:hypothetical protein
LHLAAGAVALPAASRFAWAQAYETIKTGGAGDQAAELLAIADPTQLPAQGAFL